MNCTLLRIIGIWAVLMLLGPIHGAQAGAGNPEDPKAIFRQAAQFYKAGQYDQAIAEYNRILSQGLESGPLYYNLGNCYLKRGELGRAVLNYERAKKIMPSDGDLAANYASAQSLILGSPEEVKTIPEKVLDRLFGKLSVNTLTFLSSFIYALTLVFFLIRTYGKTAKNYLSPAIGVLTFLLLLFSWGAYGQYASQNQTAVTLSERAEVKFQPFERAGVHFHLHEGMKVRVLSSQGGWIKIMASDRKVGWVKAGDVERI
jgi:tetratricopeptide (TPR) repeat protein